MKRKKLTSRHPTPRASRRAAVSAGEALGILRAPARELPGILTMATRLTRSRFGDTVRLCSIINAKCGACSEDCAFCAQSAHHCTDVQVLPLRTKRQILSARNAAATLPISHFGIVTSGPTLGPVGVERVADTVRRNPHRHVQWCASLGSLSLAQLRTLKAAGLTRFHHNIETAPSFFPRICSTHSFADRIKTIRSAKKAGLQVCAGGILGLGESLRQRVEMATTLAAEAVEAIPLNFLVPIPGTHTGRLKPMRPLDILRTIAMFRMTNPVAEIKICAGRIHLRDLQSLIFFAGATGMMVGNLLTVPGCDEERDLQMIRDLNLKPVCK